MKIVKAVAALVVITLAFGGGYALRATRTSASASNGRKILYYVDPMHPAYKSDKPGIAPDCGMALEPVYDTPAPVGAQPTQPPGTIEITPEKQQMIGVKFGTAEYMTTGQTIRTTGRVAIDETRVV